MILYRIGEIMHINAQNIIFESRGEGYSLIVPNSSRFNNNQKVKLFIYEYKNDYNTQTYAFKDYMERVLFVDLISLTGIGPRIALNLLDNDWERIANYIALSDVESLSKIPYVQDKQAKLIVVNLQNKWSKILIKNKELAKDSNEINNLNDVVNSLKIMGFKEKQINEAISKIENKGNVEEMIQKSIEFISKQINESRTTAK
ncbi:Holliday junction branch migration protein RuvA [Mycoplasmopsis anatis]|uniref:Holliday junction branch migration complex subunit RuvA n=1 Tax=Mycoplasmopsis anatis TaxID=171279 RepID=A0A9Q3L9H2_9BACT|nr:Holliday junction branch migration protein RuvA [Mycoplasmopsis anatis]MBW0594407.1 Holliday junction branch migration protein RuvA [Mycoplasmopsis anatis]MBW0595261.1 Holliday junction branch migration protein RuvA [Mycoplasmopsis anatis]MBW0596301.1 Holliday junction branch migration protein RuvA [Mycoplasmopsis anatis]MBW0596449.1 Holliday junction branch migration protein RuvA [Mycoplasmopsis anatis]MBW0597800.1 Holliday junction branch migration protein RuvA [Mycoplasmopsis anatis]